MHRAALRFSVFEFSKEGEWLIERFMEGDFLLDTDTARVLYHEYAENLPILDYHCHINPREIAEDAAWLNLTRVWLNGDHYKWRMERSNGEEETAVTGEASDWERFLAFVRALERAPGNPVSQWAHLELRRYFGYHGVLNLSTAGEVWELGKERLKSLTAREILRESHVEWLATTDDPCDSLEVHELLAKDGTCPCRVTPTFRADWVMDLRSPELMGRLEQLGKISGVEIRSLEDLFDALERRMDAFALAGCRSGDQSMAFVPSPCWNARLPEKTFQEVMAGKPVTKDDAEQYRWCVLTFLGRSYAKRGWVMQLHDGVLRNVNAKAGRRLGRDVGFDCVGSGSRPEQLAFFLNAMEESDALPKTILYSLVPDQNVTLESLAGCFQEAQLRGKIQHGAAWWFNDTKEGICRHLTALAESGLLGNFVGMLTDSRSFLSYTRHEYFRRILCGLLGRWVKEGICPDDRRWLGGIVEDICYYNCKRYFKLCQEEEK